MRTKVSDLPAALKATFSFVVIQSILFVIIFVCSIILLPPISTTFSEENHNINKDPVIANTDERIRMFGQCTIAAALFTICISLLGVVAVLYWKIPQAFGIMLAYTILHVASTGYSWAFGLIFTVHAVRDFQKCGYIKAHCEVRNWEPSGFCPITRDDYVYYCGAKTSAFNIVAYALLINGAVSVAAVVSGAVSAYLIKTRPQVIKD